jgi:hypothetical protein
MLPRKSHVKRGGRVKLRYQRNVYQMLVINSVLLDRGPDILWLDIEASNKFYLAAARGERRGVRRRVWIC